MRMMRFGSDDEIAAYIRQYFNPLLDDPRIDEFGAVFIGMTDGHVYFAEYHVGWIK